VTILLYLHVFHSTRGTQVNRGTDSWYSRCLRGGEWDGFGARPWYVSIDITQ
jgi:hypothetical protein